MYSIKNKITILLFIAMISSLMYGCFGFNLFSWNDIKSGDLLEKGDIDEFLFSLYNSRSRSDLLDPAKRREVLALLEERIANSTGEEKTKYLMAKASILSKTTSLNQIVNSDSSDTLLSVAQDGIDLTDKEKTRELTNKLFAGKTRSEVEEIIRNAREAHNALNDLGNALRDSGGGFPPGHESTAGDYAQQSLMASLLNSMVESESSGGTDEEKTNNVVDFITNPSSSTTFSGGTNAITRMLGDSTNPTGTSTILEAGGMGSLSKKLRDTVK